MDLQTEVLQLQSPRDGLAGCSSWPLRFAVYSSGGNSSRKSSSWRWVGIWEVLQLCRSALISWDDMVLAPSVACLFKWRQFEPEVILLAVGWYYTCVFHCPTATSRNSWPNAGFRSITSRSGDGCSVTPRNWSGDCANGSRQPT